MGQESHYTSSDAGGIKRGDSAETGDLTARPTEKTPRRRVQNDLTVLDADDPSLGLTNIGDVPPDDWAADTGPSHTPEEEHT